MKKHHMIVKFLFVSLVVLASGVTNAATITQPKVTDVTVNSTVTIDTAATDFYIFGDNVKKNNGGSTFTDVSGSDASGKTVQVTKAITSRVKVEWKDGTPMATSTGSVNYDVCTFGSGFSSGTTVCQFTLTMPGTAATLDFWLVPNGNTGKNLKYTVTVGNVSNNYTHTEATSDIYKRFTYEITKTTIGEKIIVKVDAVSGDNRWHNIGFQAVQVKVKVKKDQIISFGSLSNKTFGDAPFDLEATASSGLTVSYTATDPCTVSGKTVTISGGGRCSITAQQAGNEDYAEAKTVTQEFTIAKVNQIISFTSPPPTTAMLGDSITLRVAGGQSGQPVKLASSTTNICTISENNILKFEAVGTCTMTANQEGNNNYYNAAQVKIEMIVLPKPEKKTLSDKVVGEEILLKANSTSGLPVTFTLDQESRGCELQGNQVKAVSVGTCILLATQTGDATHYPASELWSFNIIKAQQTTASEKLVLGTVDCKTDDPTCCDLANPTCPAIPEPCTPPSPTTTKWLYNIPPLDAKEEVTLQLINRSGKLSPVISGRAYNPEGKNIGEFSLNGGQPIGKQQTLLVTKQDLKTALNHTWQDWLTLEILNTENLRAVSYLNYMISTGTEPLDIPVSGSTATGKHRLYNVPAPGENTVSIRVYNLSSKAMAFAARLFNQDGTLSNEKIFQFPELAPKASLTFLSTDLVQPKTRKTWEMDRWIEIFPVEKDRRCTGEMQLQLFMAILPTAPNNAIFWQNMTLPDD